MEELSMSEFRNLCQNLSPSTYVFDTSKQNTTLFHYSDIISEYTDVIFMLNPNRICFKNSNGTLCFNRVKEIIHSKNCDSTDVFRIVCENDFQNSTDFSYTIYRK